MISSVLTYVICSWYNGCGTQLLREIARVEKRCKKLIKKEHHNILLSSESTFKRNAMSTVKKITTDPLHPLHPKFRYLKKKKRLNMIQCRTKRYQNTSVPSLIKAFNHQQQ